MQMHIGLSEEARQIVASELSCYLANLYTLYLKTQKFHWNLSGPEFYALHLLFEKQYEEMAEETDEIAERIRALGYYVDATLSAFKNLSQVKEEEKILSIQDMLVSLIHSHEVLIRQARQAAEIADKERDFASVDMLGRRMGAHEKMLWMLRSSGI